MDYFERMQELLTSYHIIHSRHPRIAVLKTLLWNGLYLFKMPGGRGAYQQKETKKKAALSVADIKTDRSKLNIGFMALGSMDDSILLANYIYKFRERYACPLLNIDLLFAKNEEAVDFLFGEDIVDRKFPVDYERIYDTNHYKQYDLFIEISGYPFVKYRNTEKIMKLQPELLQYILAVEKFRLENARLYSDVSLYRGQSVTYSIIRNIKRIQQADLEHLLEVTEEYEYRINIKKENEVLNKFSLENQKYFVVASGAVDEDGWIIKNKVWPVHYYNNLIYRIKQKYPDVLLVQLGNGSEDKRLENIDVKVPEETGLKDIAVLLKHAALLIAGEGAMVHLRYAVHGGPSVVLFGPTDIGFYGYSSNINLRGEGCPYPCEGMYKDWQRRCGNKNSRACMWSITPMMIMEKIQQFMEKESEDAQ